MRMILSAYVDGRWETADDRPLRNDPTQRFMMFPNLASVGEPRP
jgi:hypothetical protein